MKVLIVSRAFHPIIAPRSFRATELAKELAHQGHEVTVLTHKRDFNYSKFETKFNLKINDFVKGRWVELKGNNILIRALRFFLNYLILFPDIQLTGMLKKDLKNYSDFDLLISIAVPYSVHWGVALAKNKNSKLCKVWVADCGDPFMGNRELKFKHPFYFHLVEKWFCNKPDFISIPIEEAIQAYPKNCRNKIKVIPQGFSFSKNAIKARPNNEVLTFAYAGVLNQEYRDPSEFLEYISSIDLPFKFVVYTKNTDALSHFKTVLADKLLIHDYIDRKQLLKELSCMDFLINFENKNKFQSPSKLIDYALSNRPILSIKPGSLNKTIVDEFFSNDYTNSMKIDDIEKFNIKNVSKKFIELAL